MCIRDSFTLAGLFDLGSLASYLVYVRQSAQPLNQFTQQVNFILAALSGAERIFEMMEEEPEVDEGDVTISQVRKREDGSIQECPESVSYTHLSAFVEKERTFYCPSSLWFSYTIYLVPLTSNPCVPKGFVIRFLYLNLPGGKKAIRKSAGSRPVPHRG